MQIKAIKCQSTTPILSSDDWAKGKKFTISYPSSFYPCRPPPGGGVLVYDFVVNNPHNPDVRKVPPAELRTLFPDARLHALRLTLAPPLARRLPAALIAPAARLAPFLRTHRLTWAVKPL